MRYLGFFFLLVAACSPPTPALYQIEYVPLPPSANQSLPYLDMGLDGVLRCSWVSVSRDTATLQYATLEKDAWSLPEEIASGTNWFVNWADYPKIAASKNVLIAHYLEKSAPDTYAYDVKAKIRDRTGWGAPFKVHSDTTQTEHGFVSTLSMEDDQFRMVWLDGRNTNGAHSGAMTLRTAKIDQFGNISESTLLDDRVCDCCATTATLTKNGPMVAYRDRSNEEIRDISLTQLKNNTWSAPTAIHNDHWKIEGCPVNGPSMDARGERVALAWFTGAQSKPRVQLALSTDAGQHFQPPLIIDEAAPFGRVTTRLLSNDRVAVVWLARNGEKAQIKLKVFQHSGTLLKSTVLAETSGARSSGFPQIAWHKDYLYFAYTQINDENSQVVVGRLKIGS